MYKRKQELNKYVAEGVLESMKQDPDCKKLKVTGVGGDNCELSLVLKKVTLWKAVFKITELQDKVDEIKTVAANCKQLYAEATKG